MRLLCRQGSVLLVLLLATAGVWAQAPPPPATQNNGPTLAAALRGAKPLPDALTLSVDADAVMLPEGTILVDAGGTVEAVAQTYGRMAQKFGTVMAVAPATMTLLNPDPRDPNIYLGMEPSDVFTLLAASLDDAQWRALTGPRGLGLADLADAEQRQLFAALFPGGKLIVQRAIQATPALIDEMFVAMGAGNEEQAQKEFEDRLRQTRRDLSDHLGQARLRLAQDIQIGLPTQGKPDRFQPLQPEMTPNVPPRDEIVRDEQYKPKDTLFGVQVRATVPNAPKAGDLNLDLPTFKGPVALAGLRTVGDLVARVGAQTRIELYADPRWERKPLTLLGEVRSAPAGDLLRALAFCLAGTFRQVGQAFVLTANSVGLGTIRQRWTDFEEEAREKAAQPVLDAADRLAATHSPADLQPSDGPLAFSPTQAGTLPKYDLDGWDRNASQVVPFAQLTPAQQEAARGFVALATQMMERIKTLAATHPEMAEGIPDAPTLQGNFRLETRPVVQILLPSESAPLELLNLDTRSLFNLSDARRRQSLKPPSPISQTAGPKLPPALSLKDVLAAVPRRALLAAPHTPAAVEKLVADMKTLGLNELWLDAFSDGQARFTAGNGPQNDVLAEALRATQGTGIRVLAVLNLFAWGRDAPAEVLDRNILGETSAQTDAREQKERAQLAAAQGGSATKETAPTTAEVSPFAPGVSGTLLSVVRALAERPGIAGLVWRDVTPPGYASQNGVISDSSWLGYAEPARLAFLRTSHADPVDVADPAYGRADTSLPGFDNEAVTAGLRTRWKQTRTNTHLTLLRGLRAAAAPLAGRENQPFLYVKQGAAYPSGEDWYGSWDDPRAPLPVFHYSWETRTPGQTPGPERPAVVQAKAQSRAALCIFSVRRLAASEAAPWIQGRLKDAPWDGLVLDAGALGDDPLGKLTEAPSPPSSGTPPPSERGRGQ